MKKVLIVHPSRGRPEQAKKIYDGIIGNKSSDTEITYILAMDDDDITQPVYRELFPPEVTIVSGSNKAAVEATNRAYNRELIAQHDITAIASDDIYFPEQWDKGLFEVFDAVGYDKAVKTTNQFQGNLDLLNFQVAGAQFWLDYGTFYWPEYINMYADDDITRWAIKNGRYVNARHLLFPHMQYSLSMPQEIIDKYGPIHQVDATYERENSGEGTHRGIEVLRRREQEGFPAWQG